MTRLALGPKAALLAAATLLAATPAAAQSFEIEAVRFSQSAYLSSQALVDTAAPYTGRPITFSDLEKMLDDIQRLYAQAGIVTAKAILPPQEISDGILRIDLVEARIGEVSLSLKRTDRSFLERNLRLAPGALPDYEGIERDLRLFEIAHDFVPELTFGPGAAPGTTDVTIGGDEPPRYNIIGSLSNFGSEQTGEAQASVYARIASLTGARDALSFHIQASEGALDASAGYSRPVGLPGGRAVGALSYAKSQIVSGAFVPVDIVSDKAGGSIGYSLPLRVRPRSHVLIDVTAGFERSLSTIGGEPLSEARISQLDASATWVLRGQGQSLTISGGLTLGNADTASISETEGPFWLLHGSAGWARALGRAAVVSADTSFQYAEDQNLPVARLFSVGGTTTMRGYPNNIRSGDSGLAVQVQIAKGEAWSLGKLAGRGLAVTPFAFADAAVVKPFRSDGSIDAEQDVLFSAGTGVRMSLGGRVSALASVGVPLRDTLGFEAKGETRIYAGVDWKF